MDNLYGYFGVLLLCIIFRFIIYLGFSWEKTAIVAKIFSIIMEIASVVLLALIFYNCGKKDSIGLVVK